MGKIVGGTEGEVEVEGTGKGKKESEDLLHTNTLRRPPTKRNKILFKSFRRHGIQPAVRIKSIRIREDVRVTMYQVSTHTNNRSSRYYISIKRCCRSMNCPW